MTSNLSNINHLEEAIRTLKYRDLLFQNEFYWEAFRHFLQLVTLAWHTRSEKMLELGAGVSTVLFADYAERTGASFYSIDTAFDRVQQVCSLNPTRFSNVERHANLLTGTTISRQSMAEFYETGHKSLCGVPANRILAGASHFTNKNIRHQRYASLAPWLNNADWKASRLFMQDDMLLFPPSVLDHFSEHKSYAGSLDFLDEHEQLGHGSLIEDQRIKNITWDMILFDCGELTSLIEFIQLSPCVRPGGLVAFHDIFFPKSFKNFIAAGIVLESSDWEVLHLDNSTIQGLLVARKKENFT